MQGDLDETCFVFPCFSVWIYVFILWRHIPSVNIIMKTLGKRSMSGLSPFASNIIGKWTIVKLYKPRTFCSSTTSELYTESMYGCILLKMAGIWPVQQHPLIWSYLSSLKHGDSIHVKIYMNTISIFNIILSMRLQTTWGVEDKQWFDARLLVHQVL